MSDPIMQLAQVIQQEFDALKIVSQNAANVNTIGYRGESIYNALKAPSESASLALGDVSQRQTLSYLNANNGSHLMTNRNLDFAMSGKGWFVVATQDGIALTRDGHFHLDKSGTLVNRQGLPVLGQDAKPIVWTENNTEAFKVDYKGYINNEENGSAVNQFFVVNTGNAEVLSQGNGLYLASGVEQANSEAYQIFQGKLEQSNTIMSQDMVKIMELSRHIESLQRAVNTYDGLLDSGINQLGK